MKSEIAVWKIIKYEAMKIWKNRNEKSEKLSSK